MYHFVYQSSTTVATTTKSLSQNFGVSYVRSFCQLSSLQGTSPVKLLITKSSYCLNPWMFWSSLLLLAALSPVSPN